MGNWYASGLVCPVDHQPLAELNGMLVSRTGRRYPVVDGVPVLLRDDVQHTLWVARKSLERASGKPDSVDPRAPELYLESLGLGEAERSELAEFARNNDAPVDPVVSYMVGATSGYSYKHLLGKLQSYPIPELRLPEGSGHRLLDIGCNWGRWSISAARKGYDVIGIDPSLGAVMAARRVARGLGLDIKYLVADARYMPFADGYMNTVFSYSVLQHFSKPDARMVLNETARVLASDGSSLIQMPNLYGIRSLQHQLHRGFRKASGFSVRYWTIPELQRTFGEALGPTRITVDCFFGLGLQKADLPIMTGSMRSLIYLSEMIRHASQKFPLLVYLADSVYVHSHRS